MSKYNSRFINFLFIKLHFPREKILHCDLKPDNILICNGKLKIADFGLATIIGVENKKPFFYKSITPKEVDQEGHSIQSDIYALGCCFLRMFSQDAEKIVSSANLWEVSTTKAT